MYDAVSRIWYCLTLTPRQVPIGPPLPVLKRFRLCARLEPTYGVSPHSLAQDWQMRHQA